MERELANKLTVVMLMLLMSFFGTLFVVCVNRKKFDDGSEPWNRPRPAQPKELDEAMKKQGPATRSLNELVTEVEYVADVSEFQSLKRREFRITGTDPEGKEGLYFDFVSELVSAAVKDVVSNDWSRSIELVLMVELLGSDLDVLRMLKGEIEHHACAISSMLHVPGHISELRDPSSRAVARFLGFGTDFLSVVELNDERITTVNRWISSCWPSYLEHAVCHVSTERSLPLKDYVTAVFLQYFIDCDMEKRNRKKINEYVFMNVLSRGYVGRGSEHEEPAQPVIIDDGGEYMEPNVYMNTVREVLFSVKYEYLVSVLEDIDVSCISEELRFVLLKSKNSFHRELSLGFSRFYDAIPNEILRHGGRYVYSVEYSNYKLLNGLLGLDRECWCRKPYGTRDEERPVYTHFFSLLNFISDGAYYCLPGATEKVPMKEYIAMLLVEDAQRRVLANSELLARNKSPEFDVKSIGLEMQVGHYAWLVLGLICDMEAKEAWGYKDTKRKLRRLREELLLSLAEASICDEDTANDHASTRAVMRLLGTRTDIFTTLFEACNRYTGILHHVKSHMLTKPSTSMVKCSFGNSKIALNEYLALVMWRYLEECEEEEGALRFATLRAFEDMNDDLTVTYEDGRAVAEEYFCIVKTLINRVFCRELLEILKDSAIRGDLSMNLLAFCFSRKMDNTSRFFSRALLAGAGKFSVNNTPDAVVVMVRRILGNDCIFMKSLEPDKDEEKLFRSVASCFPKEYRGIRCRFKQSSEFKLVDLVAKAITDYIRANAMQNHSIIMYLMRSHSL